MTAAVPLAFDERGALFDETRVNRFMLWRRWAEGPVLNVIGLNPSTADEQQDDPTIRRCIGYARKWDLCGLVMTNLFSFRSSSPARLRRYLREGPGQALLAQHRNHGAIYSAARDTFGSGGIVLAAWGIHGSLDDESSWAREMLRKSGIPTWCLGVTAAGEPKHPLYMPGNAERERYM